MRIYKNKEALLRAIERKKEQIKKEKFKPIYGYSRGGHSRAYILTLHLEELHKQLDNFDFTEHEKYLIKNDLG